jgi:hypothetical protein
MNKNEEALYAQRRLLAEQRAREVREQRAKRNPERMKRMMPVRTQRRNLNGDR